jgi:Yip1 domain
MTDALTSPAPVPGLFARAIGVIFSPKATFEKLVPSPRVFGALLLVGAVIGLAQGLPQLTPQGRQAAIDAASQQIEKFTGQPVTPEQYASMIKTAPYRAIGTIVVTPAFVALTMLFFGGLYFVIFNVVLGGTASYKQVMSIVSHAGVITALGVLLAAPVQYLQGTANPMGPFTLTAALPMLEENSFLARMLGFISVFSIWQTIVTGIGLGVLYHRKAGNIIVGLFVLSLTFAAIFASIIGMFSSR